MLGCLSWLGPFAAFHSALIVAVQVVLAQYVLGADGDPESALNPQYLPCSKSATETTAFDTLERRDIMEHLRELGSGISDTRMRHTRVYEVD